MHYMQHKLKPEVEKEIKKGFFEIRKKLFNDKNARGDPSGHEEEVQVYVSHVCLHNFHPIFSKLDVETVKIFLQYSIIVYLDKDQTLYMPGFNDSFFYVILFGKCQTYTHRESKSGQLRTKGQELNIGWTLGEEILFKSMEGKKPARRDSCKATCDSCVLGVDRKNLTMIKKSLYEKNMQEEFNKIETILRGNFTIKTNWR